MPVLGSLGGLATAITWQMRGGAAQLRSGRSLSRCWAWRWDFRCSLSRGFAFHGRRASLNQRPLVDVEPDWNHGFGHAQRSFRTKNVQPTGEWRKSWKFSRFEINNLHRINCQDTPIPARSSGNTKRKQSSKDQRQHTRRPTYSRPSGHSVPVAPGAP
jgi:hypothetical protein